MKNFKWVPVSIVSLSSVLTACGADETMQSNTEKMSFPVSVIVPASAKDLTKALLDARNDLKAPIAAEFSARCCATANR